MKPDGTDGNPLEGEERECPGSCVIIHYVHPFETDFWGNYSRLSNRRRLLNYSSLISKSTDK